MPTSTFSIVRGIVRSTKAKDEIAWPIRLSLVGRAATETQIGRHFLDKNLRSTRQAIRRAELKGQVSTSWAVQHPVLNNLEKPLVDWQPDSPTPEFEHIAWKLKSRWNQKPTRQRLVFPIGKRPPRNSEWLHDCHVVELYFSLLAPNTWVHEDELGGLKNLPFRPDAVLKEGSSQIYVDFGGRYKASKLKSLHENYQRANLCYRLY